MYPGRSGRDNGEGREGDEAEAGGNGICWERVGGRSVLGTRIGGGWMLTVALSVEGMEAERLEDG